MNYYIYALVCPETNMIRYVGKTNSLTKRLWEHVNDKHKSHKVSWIKSLRNKNLKPIIEVLEETENEKEAYRWEIYWIEQLKVWGFDLCNLTGGGEGFSNVDISGENNWNTKISEETARSIVADLQTDTLSLREICEKYSISIGTVSNIKYGKSWQKLTKNLKFKKYNQKSQGNKNRANSLRNKGVYKSLSIQVEQFDTNNKYITTYESISEASSKTRTNRSSISSCLCGKLKSANNFIWKRKH